MKIFEIENKLIVNWIPEINVIVDTWINYNITTEQFEEAILKAGMNHAIKHQCKAWIADSSKANGVFPQDVQQYIDDVAWPFFAANGIKYFIAINSEVGALTKLTVKRYVKSGPNQIEIIEASRLEEAMEFLSKKQSESVI